ncbi:MAG: VWA domain-containing protein [Sandaracinaceae bacterium]
MQNHCNQTCHPLRETLGAIVLTVPRPPDSPNPRDVQRREVPMVAPRRYAAEGERTDELADGTTQSAASALASEQPPLTLHLEVDAGLPIRTIDSPSHEVELTRDGNTRASVALTAEGEARTRDFVLRYQMGGGRPQATMLSHREAEGEAGFFSLLVQPPAAPADAEIVPRDVTFVVDTSSSMNGRPIEHARAAIRRVVEGLRDTDRFNVIGFADQVRTMNEGYVGRDATAVARASAFLDELRATGATEMVPAIERALSAPTEDGRLSIVVLVTDGYIGNEAAVLRAIATHLGDHRLYALGVGSAVNHFLVERAAEIGRGHAIVAPLTEDPADVEEGRRPVSSW